MPVCGPGDNAVNADKAVDEILAMFKEKHGVDVQYLLGKPDKYYQVATTQELEKLRQAVRNIFRLDSWASW